MQVTVSMLKVKCAMRVGLSLQETIALLQLSGSSFVYGCCERNITCRIAMYMKKEEIQKEIIVKRKNLTAIDHKYCEILS